MIPKPNREWYSVECKESVIFLSHGVIWIWIIITIIIIIM